jgi:CRP/FNR family transcriptional regulator, cyclic AMP receptor protein
MGEEGLDALHERGHNATFDAGERLLHEGEPGDRVALILSGRVKISCAGPDGRETVLDFRGPGELVGELSALDRRPRSSSVTAIEPVEALLVGSPDFRALLERPGFAIELLAVLSRRFRDADRKRIEFGGSDTVGRVAARLVELADRYGEPAAGGTVIALPISQEELAGWTAASRAGMANALRTLRELGWIETERRRITVLDMEALRARSSVQN